MPLLTSFGYPKQTPKQQQARTVSVQPQPLQVGMELPENAQKTPLGDGLLAVYVSGGQVAGEPFYIFAENCDKQRPLELVLNFQASLNLVVRGGSQRVSIVVPPGKTAFAAHLEQQRQNRPSELQWRANWKQLELDPREQQAKIAHNREKITERITQMVQLHGKLMIEGKDPFAEEAVLEELAAAGHESAIDIFFAPVGRAIGSDDADAARKPWRRATAFCDDPTTDEDETEHLGVFFQAVSADDIVQGELGNCWFMCSLASLVEFPETIDRLFLTAWPKSKALGKPMYDAHGLYELRFCMHGQWMNVQLDDYFPCKSVDGGPVFSRANGPELWVLLIEKAYAKLQGSYFNCRLGLPNEGLMDLTGAPTLRFRFEEYDVSFDDMWSWDRNSCVVCASTPGTDTFTEGGGPSQAHGLVPGHAYTVIQVRRIKNGPYRGSRVLQIRNPWGKFEWGGRWSDSSPELQACQSELDDDGIESNDTTKENDGMFWMAFEDFKRLFISVSVCAVHVLQPGSTLANPSMLSCQPETRNLPPNAGSGARYVPPRLGRRSSHLDARMEPQLWSESRVKSLFEASGPTDARLRPAHCFHIQVPKPDHADEINETLMFTLSQVDDRSPLSPGYMDVGLVIYRLDGGGPSGTQLTTIAHKDGEAVRNVLLETYLTEGEYVIVPITGGVRATPPDSYKVPADPIRPEAGCPLSNTVYYAMRRIVFSLDHDMDGRLGQADLLQPAARPFVAAAKIDVTSSEDEPTATGMLMKLADYPDGLSLETLLLILLNAWTAKGSQWRALLGAMGYSDSLRPKSTALPFVLAMHASQPVKMRRYALPSDVYDLTLGHHCKEHGRPASLGHATVHTLATGMGAVFVAENGGPQPIQVMIDCSESTNVSGDNGVLRGGVALPPAPSNGAGATPHFLLSIAQKNAEEAFSWTYSCNTGAARAAPKPADTQPLGPLYEQVVHNTRPSAVEEAVEKAREYKVESATSRARELDRQNSRLNQMYDSAAKLPPVAPAASAANPNPKPPAPLRKRSSTMDEASPSKRNLLGEVGSRGNLVGEVDAVATGAGALALAPSPSKRPTEPTAASPTALAAPVAPPSPTAPDGAPPLPKSLANATADYQANYQEAYHAQVEALKTQMVTPYITPQQATREDVQRYIRALEARKEALDRHRTNMYAQNKEYVPAVSKAPAAGFAPSSRHPWKEDSSREGRGFTPPPKNAQSKNDRGGLCAKSLKSTNAKGEDVDKCVVM